ncbi:Hypothetical predicted protein [Pelobates cultripes]|uniref:Uncharacterized protein n=1 Tax=Pelobates cultripes TaxID=61616 RepID=A0AAD1R7V9_PELCU|nr:Hypothetical predicted protein [Pelobates cultripes]
MERCADVTGSPPPLRRRKKLAAECERSPVRGSDTGASARAGGYRLNAFGNLIGALGTGHRDPQCKCPVFKLSMEVCLSVQVPVIATYQTS